MVCIESLNEELQLAVMGIFSSIPKVVATDNPLLNPSVKGLITSLLGIVEDTVKDNNLTITGKNYNAAKILTDNFFYELNKQDSPVRNLQHYAEAVGKSVDYLTRVVKKETGFSPMHWINQRTIRLAQVMLCDKTQNFSINHIANFLNFATAEHFSKLFKTIAGMSPTEYRIGNI
jgi:AraC-like DNA-binding protein